MGPSLILNPQLYPALGFQKDMIGVPAAEWIAALVLSQPRVRGAGERACVLHRSLVTLPETIMHVPLGQVHKTSPLPSGHQFEHVSLSGTSIQGFPFI